MKMENKIVVLEWPQIEASGAKRANIVHSDFYLDSNGPPQICDWFVGFGKDESCQFEGTWWDMICFARNILASKNTELVAPEYFKPEWENDNYCGDEQPYEFVAKETRK